MDLIVLSDSFGVFMETKDGINKLEGFSRFDFNSGSKCYIRRYFSAEQSSADIVENTPVILYTFDRMKNNTVHDSLVKIADLGLKGTEADVELVFVDFSEKDNGRYKAFKQRFAVKSADRRPENGFLDYSGSMVAKDKIKKGYAVLGEDLKSGEFITKRGGILCD